MGVLLHLSSKPHRHALQVISSLRHARTKMAPLLHLLMEVALLRNVPARAIKHRWKKSMVTCRLRLHLVMLERQHLSSSYTLKISVPTRLEASPISYGLICVLTLLCRKQLFSPRLCFTYLCLPRVCLMKLCCFMVLASVDTVGLQLFVARFA